jgi:hypothetical protein
VVLGPHFGFFDGAGDTFYRTLAGDRWGEEGEYLVLHRWRRREGEEQEEQPLQREQEEQPPQREEPQRQERGQQWLLQISTSPQPRGGPSAISKAIRSRKGEEKVVKALSRSEEGWDVEMGERVYLIGLPAPSLIFGAGKV